ncbi:MAG: hypothetical protein HKUEN01_20620 [Candidatus Kuenenia stuttgartiensis]|nr:MAG: hypothetical protein HKUEN01_20620 [Candidatus Kuenenia stuttgartiensis]
MLSTGNIDTKNQVKAKTHFPEKQFFFTSTMVPQITTREIINAPSNTEYATGTT